MAKAHIMTKDGSTILIEGTADEVSVLLARFDVRKTSEVPSEQTVVTTPRKKDKSKIKRPTGGKSKTSATTLVADMIQGVAFKKPKGLAEIQKELEQGGHYYSDSSVAVALLRAVKKKALRRIKQDKNWMYVV